MEATPGRAIVAKLKTTVIAVISNVPGGKELPTANSPRDPVPGCGFDYGPLVLMPEFLVKHLPNVLVGPGSNGMASSFGLFIKMVPERQFDAPNCPKGT